MIITKLEFFLLPHCFFSGFFTHQSPGGDRFSEKWEESFQFFHTIGDILEVSVGVSHLLSGFLGGCDSERSFTNLALV